MEMNYSNRNISGESNEEEYSNEIENSIFSGDKGTPINTTY